MSAHKQLSAGLDVLLSNNSDILKDGLGTIVDFKAKRLVKPGMIPKLCNAWSGPLSSKELLMGNSTG